MYKIYTTIADDDFNFMRGGASIIILGLGLWNLMSIEVKDIKNQNAGLSENLTFMMGIMLCMNMLKDNVY